MKAFDWKVTGLSLTERPFLERISRLLRRDLPLNEPGPEPKQQNQEWWPANMLTPSNVGICSQLFAQEGGR